VCNASNAFIQTYINDHMLGSTVEDTLRACYLLINEFFFFFFFLILIQELTVELPDYKP